MRWAWLLASLLAAGCSPTPHDSPPQPQPGPAAGGPAQAQAAVAVARGKIEVEGGLRELAPEVSGPVRELSVQEGQAVQRGQSLLRVADDGVAAEIATAQAEWELAQARREARAARLPQLEKTLARWRAAEREGAAESQAAEEAEQALRDARSEAALAAAEALVAHRKLEQLTAQRLRHELRAPEAGSVVKVHTPVGAQAAPGTPSITLLPERPLQVRAEVNEAYAAAVHEGMRGTVTIEGAQGPLPGVRVLRMSPVFTAARLQDEQPGPLRVIDCVLAFDAPPAGLRVGQNVRVFFHE